MYVLMKYLLRCPECGRVFRDAGFSFSCPNGCSSVVKTKYLAKADFDGSGLWRYMGYLPVSGTVDDYSEFPAVFHSEEYSDMYDADVYFILNGYSPEHNVRMRTCTFKELEAIVSLKYAEEVGRNIALSSVGNTANAFMELAKYVPDVTVYLFVPEKVFDCVFEVERSENVVLIKVRGGYGDATNLAKAFASIKSDVVYEGGGFSFARRDSLSALAYSFVEFAGRPPDIYIQSIGSGTGAISFFDGLKRLGFRSKVVVAQNMPFTPVVDAWKMGAREIKKPDLDPLEILYAKVLSNEKPLYSHSGGLYDILSESDGNALAVSETEAKKAGKQFRKITGIEPFPASSVALAVLEKVDLTGTIAVNITGSGKNILKRDYNVKRAKPDYVVEFKDELEMIP